MAKKVKPPILPNSLWICAYHTHNMLGSIAHVSSGEKFYLSKEECQEAIDKMEGWIGMEDRKQYRPIVICNPIQVD